MRFNKQHLSVLLFGLIALVLLAGTQTLAASFGRYNVYCANGKLEVDSRTLDQMKAARGNNVCTLAEFSNLADAESYASERGGKGSPCRCK